MTFSGKTSSARTGKDHHRTSQRKEVRSLAPGRPAGPWQDWAMPVWLQSVTSERK